MKRVLSGICVCVGAVLAASAQPRFSPTASDIDMGRVQWKSPTKLQFKFTNTGDAPLVLSEVEPDCSCTVADWTETPIAPGEQGVVNLTFEAETLGHFQKSVVVWTNTNPQISYLTFHGQVLPVVRDYTASHPYQIGDIRLDTLSIDFPQVYLGEQPVFHLSMANVSTTESHEPVLMHLPSYLSMKTSQEVMGPEEKCDIDLTLDTRLLPDYGLTQASVYVSRFPGDKVSEETEIPVNIVLLPDFSNMTESERINAPHIRLSSTEIDLRDVLASKPKARQDLTITNTGNSPLKISKLQVFSRSINADIKSSTIAPGQSVRLRVTVTKKDIRPNSRMRLLLICNDPSQPLVTLNIKH